MENVLKDEINNAKTVDPILKINGGASLMGEVEIDGAKNAALPSIVAACLSDDVVKLRNVPTELNDVKQLIKLLIDMGADVMVDENNKEVTCSGSNWHGGQLEGEVAGKIRHSLLLLGLSIAWKKDLELPMPGGCDLGNRKHDMHVDALRSFNNLVEENEGISVQYQPSMDNVTIDFYYPTFGGTLNALFAAVKKEGIHTFIHNAAKNPEVIDVIHLLNKMGAEVNWLDDETLKIVGVNKLNGVNHSVMPDRIIGATVVAATGLTGGKVIIKNFDEKLLTSEIKTWRDSGLTIEQRTNNLFIDGTNKLKATDITTKAYPGFHTDIQPLHTLLMTTAEGESKIKETILDGRFKYCYELNKMGANISVESSDFKCVNGAQGQIAKVKGVEKLSASYVKATDIRGGAAVAVAALAAEGESVITNLYQLERGYGNFVELFTELGANIKKVKE
ncbi:UDP-N-acetylglucosamine 1-carboxyvinyltransferase [Pelagirhabdus alkalitolerans]|uniref:UDP-N-acetylglucosamine 1-carboxyvinyltransferase n=1 Tax=Pelagirhabdus alkalitolerans TaxID=1612202 RepID=A0A1G6GGG4_9BACI|nr:UDP-N-acetylglucosamine 1-carboxyvinyltransferase [Pelagirhabdus alkalitolerans]SDB81054.1 UDP-N-acetylglucosamine 1-carboxyvinyltransferase [Pelagirhabdus alkalitolerans]